MAKLGDIVHYVSKTGQYECAAIVSATQESLFRPNVETGHLPDLSSDTNVHLVVLTPGIPGEVSAATLAHLPELARPGRLNAPAGSTYAEWNIEHGPLVQGEIVQVSGSWHYPSECMAEL